MMIVWFADWFGQFIHFKTINNYLQQQQKTQTGICFIFGIELIVGTSVIAFLQAELWPTPIYPTWKHYSFLAVNWLLLMVGGGWCLLERYSYNQHYYYYKIDKFNLFLRISLVIYTLLFCIYEFYFLKRR